MPARILEASVRHQPRVAIVDLHGEIDAFAEDVLNAAYADADSRGADEILLNFSDVDYINSTGIALIVSLLARARKSKRKLHQVDVHGADLIMEPFLPQFTSSIIPPHVQ